MTVAARKTRADALMRACNKNGRFPMNSSIFGSVVAAALTFSVATASAQPGPDVGGAPTLTPDQRGAVRVIILQRLANEMQDTLPDRLSEVTAALSQLTPEQRAAIRDAIKARLADDVREGFADKLSEQLADRVGAEVQTPPAATPSPEQQTTIRGAIRERLAEHVRERLADRIADAASVLAKLSPEQRAQVLGAVKARLSDEVNDRLEPGLAEAISQKLSDPTVGTGAK
jgi:hypothetical protein